MKLSRFFPCFSYRSDAPPSQGGRSVVLGGHSLHSGSIGHRQPSHRPPSDEQIIDKFLGKFVNSYTYRHNHADNLPVLVRQIKEHPQLAKVCSQIANDHSTGCSDASEVVFFKMQLYAAYVGTLYTNPPVNMKDPSARRAWLDKAWELATDLVKLNEVETRAAEIATIATDANKEVDSIEFLLKFLIKIDAKHFGLPHLGGTTFGDMYDRTDKYVNVATVDLCNQALDEIAKHAKASHAETENSPEIAQTQTRIANQLFNLAPIGMAALFEAEFTKADDIVTKTLGDTLAKKNETTQDYLNRIEKIGSTRLKTLQDIFFTDAAR